MAESSCNSKKRRFSVGASFNTAAQWTSRQCGRASTFAFACVLIVAWAATGPIFQYSDTWQLVINTGTTIVTFLMVFLIQNTQNRDSAALHLKLDELIRVNEAARNKLLDLEDLTEAELEHLKGSFTKLAGKTPADALLREAADDLDVAGAEIQGGKGQGERCRRRQGREAGSLVARPVSFAARARFVFWKSTTLSCLAAWRLSVLAIARLPSRSSSISPRTRDVFSAVRAMVPHPWPMASRACTDMLTTASSRFACGLTILAGVATWECEVMATGKYKGRQVSIDATQIKRLSCELGPAAIAKRLGIARSSVYRALSVAGDV